jgi:hypothetical protein
MRTQDGRYIQNGRFVDPNDPRVRSDILKFNPFVDRPTSPISTRSFYICYRNPYYDESLSTNTDRGPHVSGGSDTYINNNCERDRLTGDACELRSFQVLQNFLNNDLNRVFRNITHECQICFAVSTNYYSYLNDHPMFSDYVSANPNHCTDGLNQLSSEMRSEYKDSASQYTLNLDRVCIRNPYYKPVNQRLANEPDRSIVAFGLRHNFESNNLASRRDKLTQLVDEFGRKNVGACNICVSPSNH